MKKAKGKRRAGKNIRMLKIARERAAYWKHRHDALHELFEHKQWFTQHQRRSYQRDLVEAFMRDAPLYWQLKVENERLVAKINELNILLAEMGVREKK